jgi:hypothetical protein
MMGAPFVLGLWMVFTASMVGQAGPTAVTLGLHGHGKGFIHCYDDDIICSYVL